MLSVSRDAAPYFLSQPIHHSQKLVSETEAAILFSVNIYITTEIKMLILSLGKDVEVLEPEVLRNEIKECIEEMILKYRVNAQRRECAKAHKV